MVFTAMSPASLTSGAGFSFFLPTRPCCGTDRMSAGNSSSPTYRPDIDGLRAFAVIVVVIYHAFPHILPSGFIGVDVFFVISGYLIGGIILHDLRQGTFTLWNFYSRRIRRIFPALIIILAAALIFGWFALFPGEYRSLGRQVFSGAAFIANFFFWQEAGYFDVVAKAKPLLHLWSLGIEEQFYIVFPVLLWWCTKMRFRIATVIVTLCILSFLGNICSMAYPTANFYNPLVRVWELLAGAALCTFMGQTSVKVLYPKLDALIGRVLYVRKREEGKYSLDCLLAFLGFTLLCLALWLVHNSRPYPGWQAVLPVLGTMLLIAAGPNILSKHLLANRFAVFTGLVSYPFYLWHWVLISYAFIIIGGLDASTWFLRIWLVAVSFVLAVLTYFLVEKPIRFGAWARKGKIYALIICMVIVGAAGLSVFLLDGLPDIKRFKEDTAVAKQLKIPEHTDEAGILYTGVEKGILMYCKYTDAGAEETVAVIGDSHALAAYWGMAKLGRELGYNTVLLGWILPAGEVYRKSERDKVISDINTIFNVLKEKEDIRKVFICTRGISYMTGTRLFIGEMNQIQQERRKKRRTGYEPYKQSLQSYVDILRKSGKEVFIISENPELPDTVRDYVSRPFRPAKTDKFPYLYGTDVIKRQGEYLRLLAEIRDATVIDTIGPMCSPGKCLVFTENGLPMYWDDNHFSYIGSEFQAEHILRPYLPNGKGEKE